MKNLRILSVTAGLIGLSIFNNSMQAMPTAAQLRHSSEPAPSGWQVGTKNQSTESKMKIGSRKESSQTSEAPVVDKTADNLKKFESLFPSKPKEQLKEIGTQEVDLSVAKPTTKKTSLDDSSVNIDYTPKSSKSEPLFDKTELKKRSQDDTVVDYRAKDSEKEKIPPAPAPPTQAVKPAPQTKPITEESLSEAISRLKKTKPTETTADSNKIVIPEDTVWKKGGASEESKKSGRSIKEKLSDNKGKLAAGAVIGGLATGAGLIAAGVAGSALSGSGQPAVDETAPLSEQGSDISFEIVPVE